MTWRRRKMRLAIVNNEIQGEMREDRKADYCPNLRAVVIAPKILCQQRRR